MLNCLTCINLANLFYQRSLQTKLLTPCGWFLQVNLVDWLKMMVGNRRSEEVVDPKIENRPSTSDLKRALLTALRCLDPEADRRPKMGQVVRMLESEEYPIPREVCFLNSFEVSTFFRCRTSIS